MALLREYEAGIGISLCFQNFEAELAGLPGDYAPPKGLMVLARAGGRAGAAGLCGACGRCRARPDLCEMKRLFVRPAGRGSGLGRKLALAAMAEARRLGYARICLDTLPSMTAAQALYRALGFRHTGVAASEPARAAVRARARSRAMTAAGVADQVLRLGDGRALGFKVYGDPAGVPLLFLHGTPGSRLKFAIGHDAGKELGLAIVAPDRWGYGLSDVPDAPTLPAFAADMAALMDHLGHAHFAVGGISGGGPYAAGVAACLASRVTALALVSPMGPVADPACRRSLSRFHRFCFGVLPRSPRAIAAVFARFRASLDRSPRLAARLATLRAGARDKALLAQPEVARWLLGSFREGLKRGWPARSWTCSCSRAIGASTSGRFARRRDCGSAPPIPRCHWRGAVAGALDPRMRGHGAAGGRSFLGGGELRRGARVGRRETAVRGAKRNAKAPSLR